MQIDQLRQRIRVSEESYKKFMGIDSFPSFILNTSGVSAEKARARGYDVAACAQYDFDCGQHVLTVSTNIEVPEYVLFHEFTHILDTEMYAKGDRQRYVCLSGFTEYHASQVELMYLVGAKSIEDRALFSAKQVIQVMAGNVAVGSYVADKYSHALRLFGTEGFPQDLEQLKSAFGVLYNYFGLKSVCRMYCGDYAVNERNDVFCNSMQADRFDYISLTMNGWLDEAAISETCHQYGVVFSSLMRRFHLN